MAAEKDTPTQVINIADTGNSSGAHLTFPAAQLHDDQERRALAIERAASALYHGSQVQQPGSVIALADYVITGISPFVSPAAD